MKAPNWLSGSSKLGAKLGVGICLLGFAFLFFGWNGAASVDRVSSQFPYLISGGLTGLALVVLGGALILVETSRTERERLRTEIAELRSAIEGMATRTTGAAPSLRQPQALGRQSSARTAFVAGDSTFHTPTCRLLEGRGELDRVSGQEATRRGLQACRVCEPAPSRA